MMTCSKIRLGPGARTRTAPVFPLEQFGALTLDLLYVDQQVVRTCPFLSVGSVIEFFFLIKDTMMSDCPLAGVFTTHGTHKSWIIFRECKTSTGECLVIIFLVDSIVLSNVQS